MAEKAKQKPQDNESFAAGVIKPVVVLVVICVLCSALLAGLNQVTEPLIVENERTATVEAYLAVLPTGTSAESLTELTVTTPGVDGAVKAADGSVAIKAEATGYSGKAVTVYLAIDPNGVVSNMQVDASTQTTGVGSKVGEPSFSDGFAGWDAAQPVADGSPVDGISGATYSSKAAFNAMNSAITCYNNEIKGVQ